MTNTTALDLDRLLPCPFCGVDLKGEIDDGCSFHTHLKNDCWYSEYEFDQIDVAKWNRRHALARRSLPVDSVALNLEAQLRAVVKERDDLRAALAAKGQQEPVACRGCDPAEGFCRECREAEKLRLAAPVAQQSEAGAMTDERIAELFDESGKSAGMVGRYIRFARAVLAEAGRESAAPAAPVREGDREQDAPCRHDQGMTAAYDHVTCNKCCSIFTDEGWGIASRMWFKSKDEANFYKKRGRYPDAAMQKGTSNG